MATKYFVRPEDFHDIPYLIPDQEENAGNFTAFINAEKTKVLKKIFGLALYTQLQDAWQADPEPTSGIWFDLASVSGPLLYEFADVQYEYKGLRSLLVPYIYSRWCKENMSKLTHSGFVTAVQDENQLISGADRIVKAYNAFIEELNGGCDEVENTLYGFLQANLDDYGTDWVITWERWKFMNSFGI